MLRFALVSVLLCSPAFAQIKLSEQRTSSYVGFINPSVANGIVYADAASKPQISTTQSVILVTQDKPYKWITVEGEKFPTLEIIVELDKISATEWKFPDSTQPGRYRVTAEAFDEITGPIKKRITVEVGGTPKPDPEPPKPDPNDVVPIPGDGLRVLIVYEQDDQSKYKPDIIKQLYSLTMRQFLNSVCVKSSAGLPEYRVLDEEVEGEDSIWLTALKRKRESLPWIIISNGKRGFEGPLPTTEAETRKLIEGYKL